MIENLTNQDIIILSCLIGLIVLIGLICITITLKKDKSEKKSKNKKEDSKPDINMALATSNIPDISEEEPDVDELLKQTNEVIDDVKTEPKLETVIKKEESVIPVHSEEKNLVLEQEQDSKNRSSIEEVLKAMNHDLEKQKYETIDKYEEEQEENAVISYQELVARKMALANEKEEETTVKNVEETLTRTSYINDCEDGITPVSYENINVEETVNPTSNKFSNSDFISPVFGRLENTMEYPTLKKTVETSEYIETKVDAKVEQETDEFLNTLKEFRKNL